MYCHNCGEEIYGNYCAHCGSKVIGENAPAEQPNQDWRTETNYDKLIKYPEVRALIAQYAAQASEKLSADEFLELVDLAFVPLLGVSLKKITDVVLPVYKHLGISTGKSEHRSFDWPIQELLLKSLCALAKNGYPLESCEPASNGLVLTAKIPSDFWTWGGKIVISIENKAAGCDLSIAAKISGQLYDWGKSKGLIQRYFDDVSTNIRLG